MMVATCTAPLEPPNVVTLAVNDPNAVGPVVSVTVNCEVVAPVTEPTAPRLKTTELLDGVAEKLLPLTTIVGAFWTKLAAFDVTVGGATIVATCVAAELPVPATVTVAFTGPVDVGRVVNVTVNCAFVAAVTVPTAPELKTTESFAGVTEKFVPLMTIVGAFCARLEKFAVTVGVAPPPAIVAVHIP